VLTAPSPLPPRPAARRHRGQLWGALACGLVFVVLVVVAVVLLLAHVDPVPRAVQAPTPARPDQLVAGHCLKALPDADEIGAVVVVPCKSGHRAEVVATVELAGDDGGARPPSEDLAATVEQTCARVAVLGAPPDARYVAWVPSADSWLRGDRRGLCLLTAPTLVGSVLS